MQSGFLRYISRIGTAHLHPGFAKHRKGIPLFSVAFSTVFGFITPFVAALPDAIPPLLFLLPTLAFLPVLGHILHRHVSPLPPPSPSTTSKLRKKKPLKLPIVTQVSIPPPLPSPASSSVTSFPSSLSQTDKLHKDVEHEQEPVASSSCSAKHRFMSTDSGCTVTTSTVVNDVESPGPAIRQRAQLIRARLGNIVLTLLISQLFALVSQTVFLIYTLTTHSLILKIIQTLFTTISAFGIIFAFSLHGTHFPFPQPPGTRISVSVSISHQQRQDQPNNAQEPHYAEGEAGVSLRPRDMIHDVGDKRGLGFTFGRLGRIFGAKTNYEEPPTPLQDFPSQSSQQHGRFASISSSFSSPPRNTSSKSRSNSRLRSASEYQSNSILDISRDEEDFKEIQFAEIEDKGIALPELPSRAHIRSSSTIGGVSFGLGQLPSPPDTPRARINSHASSASTTVYSHTAPPPLPTPSWPHSFQPTIATLPIAAPMLDYTHDIDEEEEQVRIGMVTPAEKPNFTIPDFFTERCGRDGESDRYRHDLDAVYAVAMSGEVVDTAVSEPGHGHVGFSGLSVEDFPISEEVDEKRTHHQQLSEGAGFVEDEGLDSWSRSSTPTPTSPPMRDTPTPTPAPTPTPRSPIFGSSWMSLTKSRSTMSLSMSFHSGSGAGAQSGSGLGRPSGSISPRLVQGVGKKAERIRERLMRGTKSPVLGGNHERTGSEESEMDMQRVEGMKGLEFVEEEDAGGKENERVGWRGRKGHKRMGTWGSGGTLSGSGGAKSPTLIVTSPASPILGGGEWDWYPFTSKSRSSHTLDSTTNTNPKKKRDRGANPTGTSIELLSPTLASSSSTSVEPACETADFVDLTDPFASPTPGFTLPKWIGNNGSGQSVSDVGHYGTYHYAGGSSSWCGDGGLKGKGKEKAKEGYGWEDAEEGLTGFNDHYRGIGGKSRSSAQWGKLPPVPPIPTHVVTSSASDLGHYGYEIMRKREKNQASTSTSGVGVVGRKARKKRPDSPMPMKLIPSRGVGGGTIERVVGDSEKRCEVENVEMDESVEVDDEIPERPGSPVPPSTPGSPMAFVGPELSTSMSMATSGGVVDDILGGGLGRKKGSTKKSQGQTSRTRARNGSPVPIPFRRRNTGASRSRREDRRGEGTSHREGEGDGDGLEGLDLEEVLLAQRLLRRLNSDEEMGCGALALALRRMGVSTLSAEQRALDASSHVNRDRVTNTKSNFTHTRTRRRITTMGKKQNKEGKSSDVKTPPVNAVQNRDIMQRMNFLWQASVYLENLAGGSGALERGKGRGDGRRRREEEEEEEEKSEGEDGREGFGEECSTTRRIPAPRNVQSQPSIPDPSTSITPIPIEAKSRSTDAPDAHTSRLPDVTRREPTDEAATTRLTRHEIKKKRKVVVRQQPVFARRSEGHVVFRGVEPVDMEGVYCA
ncbi:hypothetical protein NP233_g2768 [Leucocoprinus birnbaumii]|uniref:Transmembrane protein n=1 Tax=Leucocoprinus birnbaumii TaxID=56174 RepID=A0AAD5YYH3_9AGAR|nr:hypothetical protein NP233_g2768 [Leucocoprinus birnbaumii]